jgi:hypothetical protein
MGSRHAARVEAIMDLSPSRKGHVMIRGGSRSNYRLGMRMLRPSVETA